MVKGCFLSKKNVNGQYLFDFGLKRRIKVFIDKKTGASLFNNSLTFNID